MGDRSLRITSEMLVPPNNSKKKNNPNCHKQWGDFLCQEAVIPEVGYIPESNESINQLNDIIKDTNS